MQDNIEELVQELDERLRKLETAIQNMIDIKYRYSGLLGNGEVLFKPKEDFEFKVQRLDRSYSPIEPKGWPVINELPEHLKKKKVLDWKPITETPEIGRFILYGNYRFVEMGKYGQGTATDIKNKTMAFKPVTHWCYIDMPPVIPEPSKWAKPDPSEASSASSETQDSLEG